MSLIAIDRFSFQLYGDTFMVALAASMGEQQMIVLRGSRVQG